ncbi:hypothetical protein NFI96_030039 [Prochilodus magdalenae]|nr:hypothetical protein NFI96_030039 [Prochilodus magdalenae]
MVQVENIIKYAGYVYHLIRYIGGDGIFVMNMKFSETVLFNNTGMKKATGSLQKDLKAAGTRLAQRTISNELHHNRFRSYIPYKSHLLKKKHRDARLKFAHEHSHSFETSYSGQRTKLGLVGSNSGRQLYRKKDCVFDYKNTITIVKLALYVYEYLLHVGAQKSAQTFLSEIRWEKNITLGEPPGFLHSWWCVFWDLYCAAPERRETCEHSSEAKAFHDYSATAVPSPASGNLPPGEGMPVPPGFFQQFISPRCPGGPRGPLRIPGQAMGPGNQTLLSGMDPMRQPGHPNMNGPMQRMTPPRGMVPIGPQNFAGGMRPPVHSLMGPAIPPGMSSIEHVYLTVRSIRHFYLTVRSVRHFYLSVRSIGRIYLTVRSIREVYLTVRSIRHFYLIVRSIGHVYLLGLACRCKGSGRREALAKSSKRQLNNILIFISGQLYVSIFVGSSRRRRRTTRHTSHAQSSRVNQLRGHVQRDEFCPPKWKQAKSSGDIDSLPKSSPGNLSMNNQPSTPRDDGEMGGNFLNPFQNESHLGSGEMLPT